MANLVVVMKVQILTKVQFGERGGGSKCSCLVVIFNSTFLQLGMGMSGDSHYVCVINVCLNTLRTPMLQ